MGAKRVAVQLEQLEHVDIARKPVGRKAPVYRQKTLKSSIGCTGVGLHSGRKIALTLNPAAPGTGLVLRRTDLAQPVEFGLSWRNVIDTRMATTVGSNPSASVGTVEHLMAALAGMEIDNAVIEVDGPEIPVMDGSAAPFVFLIECAGTVEQKACRRAIKILRRIAVGDGDASIALTPASAFSITFEIEFETAAIERQQLYVRLVNGTFKNEIAPARTFGFVHDVDRLRQAGLALGGSLENAIVISGDKVLNADGLRFQDEFVRHKILDCIGDLYLAGAPIIGHVHCARSGHALNHALLKALFENANAWTLVELSAGIERASADWAELECEAPRFASA